MFVVGLTGGIGSGKTAATDRFASHDIAIVDADLAARIVVEPGRPALEAIKQHFGPKIIQDDGHLDRRALREIVFGNDEERKWLEQLTHPLIGEEIINQLRNSPSAYTILVSPLLLESNQRQLAQRILIIDVPEQIQVERTMGRDNTTEDGVKAIMAAQLDRQQRLAKADDIIVNDSSLSELHAAVDKLHFQYLTLAKQNEPT